MTPKPLPEVYSQKGFSFLPIHTPGHSKDHTVFLEPQQGWLFSGDLYLGGRIKYFRVDENRIMKQLKLKEVLSIKLMCFGNVSMKNMVRSVIKTRGEVSV